MSFIKNFLGKKESSLKTYADFWQWFVKHEKQFHKVVKKGTRIEEDFFDKIAPKLDEVGDDFHYLTGMLDDTTVELVLTADGAVKSFVFVEDLVAAAPTLPGWKFTAHKPAIEIDNVSINMAGFTFGPDNLSFYSNDLSEYPDEIDITVVHNDYTDENNKTITNGTYIFLDNLLGELNSATLIDNLTITGKDAATKELIPIGKLKSFLTWREKEFIEKYEGTRHNTNNDMYSAIEATLQNGKPLVATINTTILDWDRKPSHPWVTTVEIKYDGSQNNGFPDKAMYARMDTLEEELLTQLKDSDGYLNIGRETADGVREIYFACKDFRYPSKVIKTFIEKHPDVTMSYTIYKDKYWQTFNRYAEAE
jgi:hypothetical protein